MGVQSGQLTHMGDIHFQYAEYCSRRKGESGLEVRAGFLEEVRSGVRKGTLSSAGREKRWAPGGWVERSIAGRMAFGQHGMRTQAWPSS